MLRIIGRWCRNPLAAASVFFLSGSLAFAANCANEQEVLALNTQVLKSELMLAALSCNQRAAYNYFVEKFNPQLAEQGDHLRGYFSRAYGTQGPDQLNRFITRLANDLSQRSLTTSLQNYCASISYLLYNTANLQPEQFHTFVSDQHFTNTHGVVRCQ